MLVSFGSGMTGRTHSSSGWALVTTGAAAMPSVANVITLATINLTTILHPSIV
jgi:hypothetical protein